MKNYKPYSTLLLILALALGGCIDELRQSLAITADADDEVIITIRVPGPSSGNNLNRVITAGGTEENRVDRVDVLLFDSSGDKRYRGRVWSTIITSTGDNTKNFAVRVPRLDTGYSYDMLILGNAKHIIDAATLTAGTTTLAEVENGLLQEEMTAGAAGGWNAEPGSPGYKPFPMWSRHENFNTSGASPGTLSIELVRMLAKIDVSFGSAAAAARLEIDGIMLTNYSTRGFLTSRHWHDTPRASDPIPSIAHLAQGSGLGINYPVSAADRANWENLVKDRIFVFERAAFNGIDLALIIRGVYKGDDPSNTTPNYYRIDMVKSDGIALDIVRNHLYSVKITGISGPGYATAGEALDHKPFNITTAIDAWNEDGMNIHTYDGRYQITVDYDRFTFSAYPTSQPLRVYTDFPAGGVIQVPVPYSDWLSVTAPAGGTPAASATVQISVKPFPTPWVPREGSFFIVAGNLRKEIKVTQNGVVWANSNVDAGTLSGFAYNAGDYGSFFQWDRRTALMWIDNSTLVRWNSTTYGIGAWEPTTWPAGGMHTSPTNEWRADNDPCPAGWRVPARATYLLNVVDEFDALLYASQIDEDEEYPGVWLEAHEAAALGLTANAGRLFGPNIIPRPDVFDETKMAFFPAAGSINDPKPGDEIGQRGWSGYYSSRHALSGYAHSHVILQINRSWTATNSRNNRETSSVRCVRID
jgi:hypothetical protein